MEQTNIAVLDNQSSAKTTVMTQFLWIVGFAALTAVGSQVEIFHVPVPFTLQTFFVLLSGAVLGKRNGFISQMLYIVAGACGVPVFSHFGFGFARLIGPTGGYLLGFPVAAFVVGYLIGQRPNFLRSTIAMLVGSFVIFSFGTLQLNFVYFHNWSEAFVNGFLIFSWWDGVKIIAASAIAAALFRMRSLERK